VRHMWSWWNTQETISLLASIARWTGVVVAVVILVLGQRLSALQSAKQRWRTITPEQRSAFINATKTSPKGNVHIIFNSPEAEISEYAEKIWEMVDSAGFDTAKTLSQGIGGRPRTGIVLLIKDREHAPAHAEVIRSALQRIGIETQIDEKPDSHESTESLDLVVGNKKP